MKNNKASAAIIILIVVVVLAVIGGVVWYFIENKSEEKACTQEAKLCPDGSYVGRTGSNCEFAECPEIENITEDEAADWKTYRSIALGFEFKYPSKYEIRSFEGTTSYIDIYDKEEKRIFGMGLVSKDYVRPDSGSSCISPYYSQGKPINLNISDAELKRELERQPISCEGIYDLKRIKLGSRDAVRFYTTNGPWDGYEVLELIVAQRTTKLDEDFYNILISGPTLAAFNWGGDGVIDSEKNRDMDEIVKSLLIDKAYLRNVSLVDGEKIVERENVFNQILSTFKFTD